MVIDKTEFFLQRQKQVAETREKMGTATKSNEFLAKFDFTQLVAAHRAAEVAGGRATNSEKKED